MTNVDLIKVAAVQTQPILFDKEQNLKKMLQFVDEALEAGAKLIVFPECALTGYVFESEAETKKEAETIPGPSTDVFVAKAKECDVFIVFGMVEICDEKFYNTAVLLGPEGFIGKYRKMFPWYPAEEKWPVTAGEDSQGFPVFETAIGRIGMLICYDMWITEPARAIALNGADIIAFPTNAVAVPVGIACVDHILRTRALENHVWIVAADRIGTERGVSFAGRSQVVDVFGGVLVEASVDQEEIVYAEITPRTATNDKMLVPDIPSTDLWKIRRPETFSPISRSD